MLREDMSRFISALLAKEKATIKTTLAKLEEASGEISIDSKLISEIVINSNAKIKQLGLDIKDTTPEELYISLNNLAKLHDGFLAKALGGNDASDIADMLPRITKFANSVASTKTIWGLKHAVAKRQVKLLPPKTLMKKLGYRSVDSMLKRENIDNLFAGIRVVESEEYQVRFFNNFARLKPSDFESRKISVRQLSGKWSKITDEYVKSNRSNLIELRELGSVIVMSIPLQNLKGTTITVLPLILHQVNDIQVYSSFFKYEQVQNDFGKILVKAMQGKPISNVSMAGLDLSWNVVRDHFGKLAKTGISDVFEPHVQTADLDTVSVEESLYKLEPALHYWSGNDCLGIPYQKGVVSFNLMDVSTNLINNLTLDRNSTEYLAKSLWDELLTRYLNEEPLHDQVLQQLDSQDAASEFGEQDISGAAFA